MVEVGDEDWRKGGAPALQEMGSIVGLERGDDDVADQVRQPRQALGEFAGGGDGLRGVGKEVLQEIAHRLHLGGGSLELVVAVERRQAGGLAPLAVHVPAKFEVVRENDVRQGIQVALELGGTLDGIEVNAHVFRFNVADDEAALEDGKVRRAAGDAGGFVDGADARVAVQQRRQRRAVGVLGATPALRSVSTDARYFLSSVVIWVSCCSLWISRYSTPEPKKQTASLKQGGCSAKVPLMRLERMLPASEADALSN